MLPGAYDGTPLGSAASSECRIDAIAQSWAVLSGAADLDRARRAMAAVRFSILNPIHHANTRAAVHRYEVDPYVACADVYAVSQHFGRGGWTWYTGAAEWLYRAGLEWSLGFRVQGARLVLDPCIPSSWPGFEIEYRHRSARYQIAVENPRRASRGVTRLELDGEALEAISTGIPLADDGATHRVRVVLG